MKIDITYGNRLQTNAVRDIVTDFNRYLFLENERYYKGHSPILNRVIKNTDAPDHRISVSYARKIVNTVVGYMYKPGLIQYATDNEPYKEILDDIFYDNNEDVKTSRAGKETTIQGSGFELHYTVGESASSVKPRFANIPAKNMIPVYNYEIEPELCAAIYFTRPGKDTEDIEIYYSDGIEFFTIEYTGTKEGMKISRTGDSPHLYNMVPIVHYYNNDEMMGDFDNVKKLIDAYDILVSDSMNEFDRFAMAYLVLKGLRTDKEGIEQIKQLRTFELDLDGVVEFLTKDINHEFIKFMSEWIRKEIHKQTHVPDFTDDKVVSGNLSGVAIDRMFYDFEFIAATKEALFRDGLYRRLDLINNILDFRGQSFGTSRDIRLVFNRNKPVDLLTNAQAIGALSGFVSKKTLLDELVPFVENSDEELNRLKEEEDVFGFGETDMETDRQTSEEI